MSETTVTPSSGDVFADLGVERPLETAEQTVERMVAEPTLDRFFDSNPDTFTDEDFRAFIAGQREERARIALKKEKKREEDDE